MVIYHCKYCTNKDCYEDKEKQDYILLCKTIEGLSKIEPPCASLVLKCYCYTDEHW